MSARTIDEALQRFTLVKGAGSESNDTACAVTLLSWVIGAAWSDRLECAHPILNSWAITANDDKGATPEDRAAVVRAAEDGMLDTWWVPASVVLAAWSEAVKGGAETRVECTVKAFGFVAAWKASAAKQRPDLRGANLRGADLRGADLDKYTTLPAGFDALAAGVVMVP